MTKKTANMVNITAYTHIGNYQHEKKGGGVSILLNNGIFYKWRKDLDVFTEGQTESTFIEITSKNGKSIILGIMYRPPNTNLDQFTENLTNIITKIKNVQGKLTPELIAGMDHNVDLLKGMQHTLTHKFIEDISDLNLLPTITRPSTITHHSAMLIDNIYASE